MGKTKDIISVEEIREGLGPVLKEDDLQILLLFGSTVSGNMHKKSDIDLAFLFDRPGRKTCPFSRLKKQACARI